MSSDKQTTENQRFEIERFAKENGIVVEKWMNETISAVKDLEERSCIYNLVLRHEQVHQQINKQALEYFIPRIYKELEQQSHKIKPIYIAPHTSEEKANQAITQAYHNIITPLVNNFRNQILQEQSKLDNQKHYQLEGNVCRYFNRKSR